MARRPRLQHSLAFPTTKLRFVIASCFLVVLVASFVPGDAAALRGHLQATAASAGVSRPGPSPALAGPARSDANPDTIPDIKSGRANTLRGTAAAATSTTTASASVASAPASQGASGDVKHLVGRHERARGGSSLARSMLLQGTRNPPHPPRPSPPFQLYLLPTAWTSSPCSPNTHSSSPTPTASQPTHTSPPVKPPGIPGRQPPPYSEASPLPSSVTTPNATPTSSSGNVTKNETTPVPAEEGAGGPSSSASFGGSDSPKAPVSAIAGGVLGSIFGMIVVVGSVLFIFSHRYYKPEQSSYEAAMMSGPPSDATGGGTGGGTDGGGGVGDMGNGDGLGRSSPFTRMSTPRQTPASLLPHTHLRSSAPATSAATTGHFRSPHYHNSNTRQDNAANPSSGGGGGGGGGIAGGFVGISLDDNHSPEIVAAERPSAASVSSQRVSPAAAMRLALAQLPFWQNRGRNGGNPAGTRKGGSDGGAASAACASDADAGAAGETASSPWNLHYEVCLMDGGAQPVPLQLMPVIPEQHSKPEQQQQHQVNELQAPPGQQPQLQQQQQSPRAFLPPPHQLQPEHHVNMEQQHHQQQPQQQQQQFYGHQAQQQQVRQPPHRHIVTIELEAVSPSAAVAAAAAAGTAATENACSSSNYLTVDGMTYCSTPTASSGANFFPHTPREDSRSEGFTSATVLLAQLPQTSDADSGYVVPPTTFLCPITQAIMTEPVVAADGFTYERVAIQEWFQRGKRRGRAALSPMTNLPLEHSRFTPNLVMSSEIAEWRQHHQQ